MGVDVSASQIELLASHATELLRWNRKINLTRICDPVEIAVKHYVDSLACVPHVPDGAIVLDIGTGGGFPGIPVAVAGRASRVVMIDSVRKKISFLQQVLRLLPLDHAEAMHIRAQELCQLEGYNGFFDVVVCRALTSLDNIIELAFPLLKRGGRIVALKGRTDQTATKWHAQVTQAEAGRDRPGQVRTVTYQLPVLDVARSLVLIAKSRISK